jgi:hypothetical protein
MNNQSPAASTPGSSGQASGSVRPSWKTWQSDEDIPQRRQLIQHMCVARSRHLLYPVRVPSAFTQCVCNCAQGL